LALIVRSSEGLLRRTRNLCLASLVEAVRDQVRKSLCEATKPAGRFEPPMTLKTANETWQGNGSDATSFEPPCQAALPTFR
jgi:hypothetical protein